MYYSGCIPEETFRMIRKEIYELADDAQDRFDYQDVISELKCIRVEHRIKDTDDMALNIANRYTYKPAFIFELEKFMSNDSLAKFKQWRKTNRSKRPRATCANCGQQKIVRIVYGMPIDESTFNAADQGKIILGGCSPTDNRYGCTNCDAEYESKP